MKDLFGSRFVSAALYFTNRGDYIFKYRKDDNQVVSKSLRAPVVAAAFQMEGSDSGWIRSGIQRTGFNVMGEWFVYFTPDRKARLVLGKKAVTALIPATVLIGAKGKYHLFAMGANEFDPGGKVYLAPFPNVHPDGQICWGQNPPPKVSAAHAAEAWNLFFTSPFNGDLANNKSKKHPTDVRAQLREAAGMESYPIKDMHVYRMDLDRVLEELIRRQN